MGGISCPDPDATLQEVTPQTHRSQRANEITKVKIFCKLGSSRTVTHYYSLSFKFPMRNYSKLLSTNIARWPTRLLVHTWSREAVKSFGLKLTFLLPSYKGFVVVL